MTIALDATYSLGNALSGVGLYSQEILYGLATAHREVHFDFCYRWQGYRRSWREKLPVNASRRLLAGSFGPRGAALFHGLNQRLPRFPMERAIATFHDLFVLTGEYSTAEFRARFAEQARDAAARSAAIITVSEFTRRQVVELLGVEPPRVFAIPHGIRPLAFPNVPRENVILNVGAIQKRKNIARLVKAFESVDPAWRLVLAGSEGFGAQEILSAIAHSPAAARIAVLGYVTPGELAEWYARAQVFAFPSLDEGFGMPVLEAMAAGVPVITSNRSALPEVAGEAAVLVNPEDTEELAAALRRLTREDELRRQLVRLGTLRARLFTWEKAVRETWDVYRRVLG